MPTTEIYNEDDNAGKARFSEVVQDIISGKPGFFIRYGVVFFLTIIILLILICWYIQYPDIVVTKARLKSINAPKEVVTKNTGKLVKLFAREGILVKQGQVLGFVESTADHDEVLRLAAKIDSLQARMLRGESQITIPQFNSQHLGELQQSYQVFIAASQLFRDYLSNGFYLKRKNLLIRDQQYLQKLHDILLQQKSLVEQDVELSRKTFDANESLKKEKVISDFDYRSERSRLINKELSLPQITSALVSNEAQQNEKIKEISTLENTISQQKTIFIQALNTFISLVEDWKKKYILIAPIQGKVAFAAFFQENQQLQNNQTICYINPGNTEYYAEIFIPQINFGKVKTDQEVLLKFPSYPYEEYGAVKGKIDFISDINTDSGYLAKVSLTEGLNTSYNKRIQYHEGLIAQGEIITENMRLLQRFYHNMIKKTSR